MEKSGCRKYKFQKSLQYELVTSHWYLLCLNSPHIPVPKMLQDNVMQLSKLLLTAMLSLLRILSLDWNF